MIICCGEALIDMIPQKTHDDKEGFVPHAGGAVFNTAIALGRLGEKVAIFSGVSTDLFGQILTDRLQQSHVEQHLLARSARPTTLAFVTLHNGQAQYQFYDENSAGRMITPLDIPRLGKSTKAVFFGGISLAVEPCADTYAEAFHRYERKCLTMIDPNIRPGFIQDRDRYRARLKKMIAAADVMKLSDEDAAWLSGTEDLDASAQHILAAGASLLLITRGAAGARAYRPGHGPLDVPSEKVKVVDTVGAGDTFNAGFLHGLCQHGALSKEAVRAMDNDVLGHVLTLSTKAAAVTVSRQGANPPWKDDLASL